MLGVWGTLRCAQFVNWLWLLRLCFSWASEDNADEICSYPSLLLLFSLNHDEDRIFFLNFRTWFMKFFSCFPDFSIKLCLIYLNTLLSLTDNCHPNMWLFQHSFRSFLLSVWVKMVDPRWAFTWVFFSHQEEEYPLVLRWLLDLLCWQKEKVMCYANCRPRPLETWQCLLSVSWSTAFML